VQEDGCVMSPRRERTYEPVTVPFAATPTGEPPSIRDWANPSVWTDRMLTTLEQGVRGGRWHTLNDKVYPTLSLDRLSRPGRLDSRPPARHSAQASSPAWPGAKGGPPTLAERLLRATRVVQPERSPCSFRSILPEVNHQLESRMREIRQSGSEGGGAGSQTGPPYPYRLDALANRWPVGPKRPTPTT
jgi:hypothetical protein